MRPTSRVWLALLVVAGGLALDGGAEARSLNFDERVAAQHAIEEVYWNHRIWPAENPTPKPALSAVMSEEALRARVEETLRKSNALEAWWQRPVTSEQLQAEMERMAAQSRDPDMLRELFTALGNDPFVIAETLVRQTLVERLIRAMHASDERLRAPFDSWWGARRDGVAPRIEESPGAFTLPAVVGAGCVPDTWTPTALPGPTPRSGHAAVWTGTEMIVWGGLHTADTNTGSRYIPATGTWTPTSTGLHVPSARRYATAIWTGREMVVWGGWSGSSGHLNTGGRYDPSADTWASTSIGSDVPSKREGHTVVWTGTEMVVWGGYGTNWLNTGGRYDPDTDSWQPTSTGSGVPAERVDHAAVWTGREMIVWGGEAEFPPSEGGRYDPSTDTWTPTSGGPGAPELRSGLTAVWTGTEMIIWGGYGGDYLNTGGRYDPSTDSWRPTSTGSGVPMARWAPVAVWTGKEMIVWGGRNYWVPGLDTGARYDPSSDDWVATPGGAPSGRTGHTAVWGGTEMLVWGGDSGGVSPGGLDTGALYCACPNGALHHPDADGDGFGDTRRTQPSCDGTLAPGFVLNADDCDDTMSSIHPGAPEICNGFDDDCDGVRDANAIAPDSDADGVVDCLEACPSDPNKLVPGSCGCGVADSDADLDGTADCIDECPADPAQRIAGLFGAEFQVNAYTPSQQGFPAVAALPGGVFVVVWTSVGQDGSLAGVYGRRFDGAGQALGDDFRINDFTPSIQTAPAIAADDGFGFVVAWTSQDQDGFGFGVFARRYDPTGQPLGEEFQVNVEAVDGQRVADVAIAETGAFVVVWESVGQDGSGTGIYARRFDAAGQPLGGEFRVNVRTGGDQSAPTVAYVGTDEFVVVWHGPRYGGADRAAFGRRFDAAGQGLGDEFLLGTTPLNECCVDIAEDPLGGFVAAWERQLGDGSAAAVFARLFNAAGGPAGPEFLVNTQTLGNQTLPAVAVDAADNLVTVWASSPQDGSGYGVYGQRFDAAGDALGGEFRLNEYTALDQSFPAVAANSAGQFLAVWHSAGQDGSSYGVFARRGVIDGDLDNDGVLDCGGPCLDTPPGQCCRPSDGALTPIEDTVECTLDVCALDGAVSHPPALPPAVGPTLRLGRVEAGTLLSWSADSGSSWNVYRGSLMPGELWVYDEIRFAAGLALPETVDADVPATGMAFYYLVGAVDACGESAIGAPSDGGEHFAAPGCALP